MGREVKTSAGEPTSAQWPREEGQSTYHQVVTQIPVLLCSQAWDQGLSGDTRQALPTEHRHSEVLSLIDETTSMGRDLIERWDLDKVEQEMLNRSLECFGMTFFLCLQNHHVGGKTEYIFVF